MKQEKTSQNIKQKKIYETQKKIEDR